MKLASLVIPIVVAACGSDPKRATGDAAPAIDAPIGSDTPDYDAPDEPADMVAVPQGAFTMGNGVGAADEQPVHIVVVPAYMIDRTEVTQAAYAACVTATTCTAPAQAYTPATTPNLPVVSVTWQQAVDFCAFRGKRLPTEAEWEKAARGTDSRTYPWGNTAPTGCDQANVSGCGGAALDVGAGIRATGASPYGALDMAGNVWEWTHDYYAADYYASAPPDDPQGPSTGTSRVYRGGSAGNDLALAVTTNRADTYSPTVGGTGLGFRCASGM